MTTAKTERLKINWINDDSINLLIKLLDFPPIDGAIITEPIKKNKKIKPFIIEFKKRLYPERSIKKYRNKAHSTNKDDKTNLLIKSLLPFIFITDFYNIVDY